MATNIGLLPQIKIYVPVGTEEDLNLAIAFSLADGVTPIDCTGISFILSLWNCGSPFLTQAVSAIGTTKNLISFVVPAASKTAWGAGSYLAKLLAVDSTVSPIVSRSVFSGSSIKVGQPGAATVQTVKPSGATNTLGAASIIPPGLLSVIFSADPAAIAAAMTLLPASTQNMLGQSLVGNFPDLLVNGTLVPAAGQAFWGVSGLMMKAR